MPSEGFSEASTQPAEATLLSLLDQSERVAVDLRGVGELQAWDAFEAVLFGFHFPPPVPRHSATLSLWWVESRHRRGISVEDHGYRIFTWFSGIALFYLVAQSLVR